jgi:tRNA threonylcarbamoyl adenosine modification protein YeaZ
VGVLLAIDTSAGTSVALVDRDAGVLAERDSADTRGHAEIIGTFIAEVLRDVDVTTLSGVAVGMGPGPFTGLRVGIAAARAFAFGISRPVVPVVSHDAVAFGLLEPVLVVTDARRRELYWSRFAGSDAAGLPIRVDGPGLCRPDDLPEDPTYRRIDALQVSAASVGMLAESLFANKRPFASDEALYLRAPDVTVPGAPKRVS